MPQNFHILYTVAIQTPFQHCATFEINIAHPINIGTHGNTETGDEVLEDMLFKNIDILEHDEDDRDYQGCIKTS